MTTSSVYLPNIVLPPHSYLSFQHIAIVRNGSASVEISRNHRSSYTVLKSYSWLSHPEWFDGTADPGDWFEERLALSAYAGDTVTIRLRLTSTDIPAADGWYIDSLVVVQSEEQTVTIDLASGWNMLSNPVVSEQTTISELFPSATSKAFTFSKGYAGGDSLVGGAGYWVKFPEPAQAAVTGFPVLTDSIDVVKGWNMVGSLTVPIDTASITTFPPAMIRSSFYGYDTAYYAVQTLLPGKAYWVKVAWNGWLLLRPPPSALRPKTAAGSDTGLLEP